MHHAEASAASAEGVEGGAAGAVAGALYASAVRLAAHRAAQLEAPLQPTSPPPHQTSKGMQPLSLLERIRQAECKWC